jgi:small subunit ribosomal protein S16
MLVIRLARTGRTKYPTYRIVAAESARAATGKFIAILGHYNPHTKELVIKNAEAEKYLANGAQPSNTVIKLMKQEKVKLPAWVVQTEKHKQPKKAPVEKAAPAAAAEASDATEAPAEEMVATNAEANAEAIETTEAAASEDTASGEEAQAEAAEAVEAAGDAAVEAAADEAPAAE